ncbi:protein of unknown function [Bradyrhizobium vignae]|uniref:Uncharacterized protein n=1 Tax=Bradyrhizobium vignae TaxID=1549949 RepID=A0A2U3PUR6_9BRAD|nr:protein of unknown function [Bradyrhizobium vignae]
MRLGIFRDETVISLTTTYLRRRPSAAAKLFVGEKIIDGGSIQVRTAVRQDLMDRVDSGRNLREGGSAILVGAAHSFVQYSSGITTFKLIPLRAANLALQGRVEARLWFSI